MCDPTTKQAPDRRGTYLMHLWDHMANLYPPPRDMDDVDNDGGKEKNVVIVFKGNGTKIGAL